MWSVVVVAKGMWSVTQQFLETLLLTTKPDQISQVIYIDNGTPPEEDSWNRSYQWAKQNSYEWSTLPGKPSVLRLSGGYPPWNLSQAWNRGISHATNEKILVCNNDIIFHRSGWLDEFEAGLDKEGIGIVGLIGMSWKDTPFIQGSIMGFKRATYDAAGRFDEQFEFTCEDVDFSKQIAKLGLGIKSFEKFRDDGTIEHLEGATRNHYKGDTLQYQYLAHLSRLRFCYKYFDELGGQVQIHD